jgi:hypothetical protein
MWAWIGGHGFTKASSKQPGSTCRLAEKMVVVSPLFGDRFRPIRGAQMPSLFRFIAVVGLVGGLTYGAMFALANWFDPTPREITVSIPPDKFAKQR